jgi:hypothetical protein
MRPRLQVKFLVDRVREASRPVTARIGSDNGFDGRFAYEGWVVAGVVCGIVSTILL